MKSNRLKKYVRLCYLSLNYKINRGYCPICEQPTYFVQFSDWLRDYYKCFSCDSIPRNRALVTVITKFVPGWKNLTIHESSPSGPASEYIKRNAKQYSQSFFFPNIALGTIYNGNRCENLERMTFPDNSFDLFITQDVFEHINHPDKAFGEIARVLKPDGIHIFTVPLYRELQETRPRIVEKDGEIQLLLEAIYHGNPISIEGSLVTFDYGMDLPEYIFRNSGMTTTIYFQKDPKIGVDGEFLEVFVSRK